MRAGANLSVTSLLLEQTFFFALRDFAWPLSWFAKIATTTPLKTSRSRKTLCLILSLIFFQTAVLADNDLEGLGAFSVEGVSNNGAEGKQQGSAESGEHNFWSNPFEKWESLEKEQKLLITNVAGVALISVVGLATWDYGSSDFHTTNEGWFGRDTIYGGADKLGHAWSTYAFSDALGALYTSWGYGKEKAATYSSISSWVVMGMMEVGDASSSDHGFSYEDLTMNSIGALTSFFLQRHPEIDKKIDFRVEYTFNKSPEGIVTDYDNLKFFTAIKFSGFNAVKSDFLKHLELHVGYYTRGYDYSPKREDKSRNIYIGLSINFSRLFSRQGYKKTSKVLEYIQIPYTSPSMLKIDLNK